MSLAGSGRLQRAHSVHEAPLRSARSIGIGCVQVHVFGDIDPLLS
jgi:hypothetical protein